MTWRNKFSSPSRIDTFAMYLTGSYWGRKDKETGEDLEFTDQLFVDELLKKFEKTPQMKAGSALHKLLEDSIYNDELKNEIIYDGQLFNFNYQIDCKIPLPAWREVKIKKEYKDIVINGIVDGLSATTVYDHKLTKQISLEKYMNSWQWKIYCYMLNTPNFVYNLFQGTVHEDEAGIYKTTITKFEPLKLESYPGMHAEVEDFYLYYWDVLNSLKPLIIEMALKNRIEIKGF